MKLLKFTAALIIGCFSWTTFNFSQPAFLKHASIVTESGASITPVAEFSESAWLDQTPLNTPTEIGNAQGRLFCSQEKSLKDNLGENPTEQDVADNKFRVAQASLAFRPDVAIVSRHMFQADNGNTIVDPAKCYYEHLNTKRFYRIKRVIYSPLTPAQINDSSNSRRYENDFALALIEQQPANSNFIPRSSIKIEPDNAELIASAFELQVDQKIVVRASYAGNRVTGHRADKTIVYCKIEQTPQFSGVEHFYSTNCSEGAGSSGAPVWDSDRVRANWIGVVSGDSDASQPDAPWAANGHNSIITLFGPDLIGSYNKLISDQ